MYCGEQKHFMKDLLSLKAPLLVAMQLNVTSFSAGSNCDKRRVLSLLSQASEGNLAVVLEKYWISFCAQDVGLRRGNCGLVC